MMSIGDIAYEIGLSEQASEIDNRILSEAAASPEFAAKCGKNGRRSWSACSIGRFAFGKRANSKRG